MGPFAEEIHCTVVIFLRELRTMYMKDILEFGISLTNKNQAV